MFYMVFTGTPREDYNPLVGRVTRVPGIDWGKAVGVYRADTPEGACKRAAKSLGYVGSMFAVEGFPWGVELMADEDVGEMGVDDFATFANPRLGSGDDDKSAA